VFPLDLVKTRLQNQIIGPNGERMYKSMYVSLIITRFASAYFFSPLLSPNFLKIFALYAIYNRAWIIVFQVSLFQEDLQRGRLFRDVQRVRCKYIVDHTRKSHQTYCQRYV